MTEYVPYYQGSIMQYASMMLQRVRSAPQRFPASVRGMSAALTHCAQSFVRGSCPRQLAVFAVLFRLLRFSLHERSSVRQVRSVQLHTPVTFGFGSYSQDPF